MKPLVEAYREREVDISRLPRAGSSHAVAQPKRVRSLSLPHVAGCDALVHKRIDAEVPSHLLPVIVVLPVRGEVRDGSRGAQRNTLLSRDSASLVLVGF